VRYKAAIPWSAFINLAEIKWGMDVLASTLLSCPYHSKQDAAQLSNKVISVPSFQQGFEYNFNNTHVVSASWQIAFNTAASIGDSLGLDILRTSWERGRLWACGASQVAGQCSCRPLLGSLRLRSRVLGLGIVVQSLLGILMNIVIPLLIDPDAANL
jgi:hypothetical protein